MTKKKHLRLTDAQVAAMDDAIDRSLAGKVRGPGGPIDPVDRREVEADIVRGRDRDPTVWNRVMESRGFVWYSPARMNREVGLQAVISSDGKTWTHRLHDEGQWRCARRRLAFTIKELAATYGTPETFAGWIDGWDFKQRAARAGIVLPRG